MFTLEREAQHYWEIARGIRLKRRAGMPETEDQKEDVLCILANTEHRVLRRDCERLQAGCASSELIQALGGHSPSSTSGGASSPSKTCPRSP